MRSSILLRNKERKTSKSNWPATLCFVVSFWFLLSGVGTLPLLLEYSDGYSYFEFLQNMEDFIPEEDSGKKIEKDDWCHKHTHRLLSLSDSKEHIEHQQCDESLFYKEHIADIISPPPDPQAKFTSFKYYLV